MKRILHLIDTTGPGGAETVFLTLITSLGSEWESIPVVAGPGWVEDSVRDAGFSPLLLSSSGRFDLSYLGNLTRVIKEHRVDLVQTHLYSTTLYGSVAGRIRGVPVVGTFHGDPDLRAWGWQSILRNRLIRSCAHKVVCVSSSLKARAMEKAGFREEDLEVIPNGIDTTVFSPGEAGRLRAELGVSADTFLVGSVGNVRPAKDYATLLRTARIVKEQVGEAVHFVIAGQTTPPVFDELAAMQRDLGLGETVSFMGFRQDIPDLLRSLDILLLTSAHEGFSLVSVQAMATGLPVVATRCGGPEEILTDGKDGILCPVGDHAALADAVIRLRGDGALREAVSRTGRSTVTDRFSKNAMIRAYEGLYQRALG